MYLNESFQTVNLQEITPLTDGIFKTGAYGVPSKSQNQTILGQGPIF